jgi:hypothetical protein
MTAEIAIMNKTAVALAADSAVTIEQDKGQKIFNTVNKLFTLSKYHPVGGPIDVAVISKGDGFVWIKRKHYFKPELNPGFFANYFRENKEEPINEKDQN